MLLSQALSLHKAGRRAEADAAYRAVLAAEPDNAQALHLYGVLRHQSGDSASAVALIDQAIARQLGGAECWFNLGLAHVNLGDMNGAAAAFQRATTIKPDWPEPHYDLGNALARMGRHEEAVRAFRAALRLRPSFHQAAGNLANVLREAGKLDQAVAAYRRLLRAHPDLPEVQNNLGSALQLQGDVAGAEAAFRAAIALRADFVAAVANLAALLVREARWADALPVVLAARALVPDNAAYAELHGDTLRGLLQFEAARTAYREAIALQPGRYTARFGLAEAWRLERNGETAERELRALLEELPVAWVAHHDLANVLRDLGRFGEAEASYRRALALQENPLALKNLGAVLRDQQRIDEALEVLQRAAAAMPTDDDVRYNISIAHLSAGRLREGFALYDSRFGKYKVPKLPGRAWTGQPVRGRRVLVAAEQGLGDTIQFVRYVPELAARGARVVLRVPPALTRLLTGFPGVEQLIARDDPAPPYDLYCHLMSLPALLGVDDPQPIAVPYLTADERATEAWRARLAALPGRPVGLVWAGNPGFTADHMRSLPPASLGALRGVAGVSFVSLQKGDAGVPDLPIADWTAELGDMADTAALVAALDLVIGVDTGVVHLTGALGRPVWMLNRFDTCWRWLLERNDSIWYPSLRLFRQTVPRDWSTPLREVAAALSAL
jgi:tetratricopeptide (TPR) repeat protein